MFYLWQDGERHRNIFSVFYECQRGHVEKAAGIPTGERLQ